MPRIDNSDPAVLEWMVNNNPDPDINQEAAISLSQLKSGQDISGTVTPYDVCEGCYFDHFMDTALDGETAHPDYEDWLGDDDPYTCILCGQELGWQDN